MYPSEEDLNLQTDIQLEYKEVPPENYRWDTNLKFVEWDGIFPQFKNPADVTDNTLSSGMFKVGVSLVRTGVFLLQMGFSTNILKEALGSISGKIEVLSNDFFNKVFPTVATLLVIFMAGAWLRGRKGEMFKLLFVALFASALMLGGAKHITTVGEAASGIIDDLCLSIVGILNLDGTATSSDIGLKRIANTNNMIWQVTVDQPWTAGQFGSIVPPSVGQFEKDNLDNKGVAVNSTDNWKDLFLRYRPGSKERDALIEVLSDEDIQHTSEDASLMMKELGPPVRSWVAAISIVNSLAVLILVGIVAGLMNVSGILLLAGIIAAPFMVPLPFLAHYGMNMIRKYLSLMIGFALLKISATFYMLIIMLLLYLISLIDSWHYLIVQVIFLVVLIVGIYLSPNIWRRMAPGIATVAGVGERAAMNSYNGAKNTLKKLLPPENSDQLFERYGAINKSRSLEREMERERPQSIKFNDPNTELEQLKTLKQTDAAQYVASGLEQREQQLETKIRKEQLASQPLTQIQKQRQTLENRMATGDNISEAEMKDLKLIQQAERKKVKSMVQSSDRSRLDKIWDKQESVHKEKQALMHQKIANPMQFIAGGGEAKLKYLDSQDQLQKDHEKELLRANAEVHEGMSDEQVASRKELNKFVDHQGNEGMMNNHLENFTPEIEGGGRMMLLESMTSEERAAEQEVYNTRMKEGEGLSADEQNEYFYLQHLDWSETIGDIGDSELKNNLEHLHTKEVGYEAQLREMNHARDHDPDHYQKMGGRVKQETVQKNLYEVKQNTQEALRNSGHREKAEKHLQLAEKGEKMLQVSKPDVVQNIDKGPSKVVTMQDYKSKETSGDKNPIIEKTPVKQENLQKNEEQKAEIEKPPMTHAEFLKKAREERARARTNSQKI